MDYARHIGRVGALAVTLGVGAAIANAPGIAYAGTPGASPDGGPEQKTASSPTDTATNQPSPPTGTAADNADDAKPTAADRRSQRRSAVRAVVGAVRDIADGAVAASGNAAGAISKPEKPDSTGGSSLERKTSSTSTNTSRLRTRTKDLADAAEKVESTATSFTRRIEQAVEKYTAPTPAVAQNNAAKVAPEAVTTAVATPQLFEPRPRTSVVPLFTNALGSVLQPLVSGGGSPGLPQLPTLAVIFAAVRDELERTLGAGPPQPVYPSATTQPTYPPPTDPANQHVLVIAIDGTNLSKVLELEGEENDSFREVMNTGTTSAPSIVGHTTISNPSWTAILTGAWDNKTGVINNVYTPTTYDRWPTVFTQLEQKNSAVKTKAIADWDVIGAIAASGEGADKVVYISQVAGDTDWSDTDDLVTDEAVKSIKGTAPGYTDVPNFMVTYLVQVDEAGHMYGGDSQQYEDAIIRTDDNLGEILQAVADREAATCAAGPSTCEDWTVIVVTDHGHQPQPGFGHGFQSPRETDTFVIVDGPQFGDSKFNPDYEIVDVTPTVLSLFGVPQGDRLDGVPLQSLHGSDTDSLSPTALKDALEAQMASNDYPNIIVNVALSTRTIVAFLPYYVQGAGLPAPLGDILYVATNVPAQLVAFGTGVWGARLFPILPPPPAITFIPDQATSVEAAFRTDCGAVSLDPASCVAV